MVYFGHGAIRCIFFLRNQSYCALYFNNYIHILAAEKLDSQEHMPDLIKEEPKKEESENQNVLEEKTCLSSADIMNTSGKFIFKIIIYSKFLYNWGLHQ